MTEDIHNLLGKYFSGQVTKDEEAVVEEWKNANKANAHEFELMEKVWYGSDQESVRLFDTETAWQKVNAQIRPSTSKTPVITLSRIAIGIAASLILVLGFWWLFNRSDSSMETIIADIDVKEIRLEDGSLVFLRKGTSLQYPKDFNEDSREVILHGEAFFDITKDPSRPFTITAEEASIQVLGTSFSVNTNPEGVSLIVKTGKVRFMSLQDSSKTLIVNAGERARLTGSIISKEANTDGNFNAWQTKQLIFNDTPLSEVIRSISDYYGVDIQIRHEDAAQIADKGVTIEFRDQALESVLKELEMITTYSVKKISVTQFEISIK